MNGYETIHIKDARVIRCGNQEILYCNASFYKRPYDIIPTVGESHDFRQCDGCKAVRARIIELLTERHKKFPYCCDFHSKLKTLPELNPDHFEGIC